MKNTWQVRRSGLLQTSMTFRKNLGQAAKNRLAVMLLLSSLSGLALAQTANTSDTRVTVVQGESWLSHIQRSFNETSMGKTGRLGPAPSSGEQASRWQLRLSPASTAQRVTLHGSDLYRLNCQGCHGESGAGAPPEINSVINPVRATSVPAILERMKNVGMDITRADASKLAAQSNKALLQRISNGGQDMPAFPQLRQAEVLPLLGYLRQLSGVGVASERETVEESHVRVGELIVKSTCHTCHAAAGEDPSPQQLLAGAIPPLNTLTTRTTRAEFVRKVTHGAPILMGAPALLYRGRMPVFDYLTQDEAADVYLYLNQYAPATTVSLASTSGGATHLPDPSLYTGSTASAPRSQKDVIIPLLQFAIFPAALFLFLGTLLVKGLPLTVGFRQPPCRSQPRPSTQNRNNRARPIGASLQGGTTSRQSTVSRITA